MFLLGMLNENSLVEIIDVNVGNVEVIGFFCYLSKWKWPVALV